MIVGAGGLLTVIVNGVAAEDCPNVSLTVTMTTIEACGGEQSVVGAWRLTEAIQWDYERSWSGTATLRTPTSSSWSSRHQPCSRTWSRAVRSRCSSVTVVGVNCSIFAWSK